jgi:hypothetical protein
LERQKKSGRGAINLTAPDSGTYEGLLFFQDRTVTYSTANVFNGNASSNTSGAFYFPTTSLTYSGSIASPNPLSGLPANGSHACLSGRFRIPWAVADYNRIARFDPV